jgi:hypothetical protein
MRAKPAVVNSAALRREHERRFGLLLALQAADHAHFIALDRMRRGRSLLNAADVQRCAREVHLIPTKVRQFARA